MGWLVLLAWAKKLLRHLPFVPLREHSTWLVAMDSAREDREMQLPAGDCIGSSLQARAAGGNFLHLVIAR